MGEDKLHRQQGGSFRSCQGMQTPKGSLLCPWYGNCLQERKSCWVKAAFEQGSAAARHGYRPQSVLALMTPAPPGGTKSPRGSY